MTVSNILNIGCGSTHHSDWINLDVSPVDPNVRSVDIAKGLPFPPDHASVCYCSHVIEHFDRAGAQKLVAECFRVLRGGGVVRFVAPDLESLVREYLRALDDVASGGTGREQDYDWLMLEIYDQAVRNSSGGEMARFLRGLDVDRRDFVRSRIGAEAENFWASRFSPSNSGRAARFFRQLRLGISIQRLRLILAGWLVYLVAGKGARKSFQVGVFRRSGEVHQWMYDRFSLKRLFEQAGFIDVRICAANESRIPDFDKYSLDVSGGVVRKPDSIFVEAMKP